MRWLHFHRDPNWQAHGANRYYICKCGAVRVAHGYSNMLGPVAAGWPRLIDRHNQSIGDSGWVRGENNPTEYPKSDVRLPRVPSGPAPGARGPQTGPVGGSGQSRSN